MIAAEVLTRQRGTALSGAYARPGVLWAAPDTVDFLGSVQPMAASEDVAPAERLVTRWLLVSVGVPDVAATDRVRRADGTVLEVDGDVGLWQDPRGAPHHVEAVLKKVTG